MAARRYEVKLPSTIDGLLASSKDKKHAILYPPQSPSRDPSWPDIIWHYREEPTSKVLKGRRSLAFLRQVSFLFEDVSEDCSGYGLGIYFEDENLAGEAWHFHDKAQIKDFLRFNGIYRPAASGRKLTLQLWNKPLIVFYGGSGHGLTDYVMGVGLKKNLTDLLAERPHSRR